MSATFCCSSPSSQEGDGRRAHNFVKDGSAPNEQSESDHLEPLERFPAETEADDPNEERAAGVDCAARSRRDQASYAQTEEVEATACMLASYSSDHWRKIILPNGYHNQNRRHGNCTIRENLVERLASIEVPMPNRSVQYSHADESDHETE